MVDQWLDEVKQRANPEDLGMIMIHNGIVRGTSKSGRPVQGMKLSYDQKRLNSVISIFKQRTGVVGVNPVRNSSGALNPAGIILKSNPAAEQRGIISNGVKAWINSGNLKVGDNIMFLLVTGRFKTDVLPVFEELLSLIKNEIVTEEEV